MNAEEIRQYCLSKKEVTESFPFDNNTLVFKVMNKMFLLLSLENNPPTFNVKCVPEMALQLREQFPENVLPGYHMSKTHWNTIVSDGLLSRAKLQGFIDDSYNLIVSSLPKYKQQELTKK